MRTLLAVWRRFWRVGWWVKWPVILILAAAVWAALDGLGPAASPYYANCEAVREAGVGPLQRGDPGYGSHLDRDGDGVACEE